VYFQVQKNASIKSFYAAEPAVQLWRGSISVFSIGFVKTWTNQRRGAESIQFIQMLRFSTLELDGAPA